MSGSPDKDLRFDKKAVEQAFGALSDRLRERGVRATVYIVGGAAMILAHRRSENTLDVDALMIDPREAVLNASREVARARGLAHDWLNDKVRSIPHIPRRPDSRAITLYDSPHLVVTGASAAHLLAMKVRAWRQSDGLDIKNLMRQLDVRAMREVREIHDALFPNNPLPPRQDANAMVLLRQVLREDQRGRTPRRGQLERQLRDEGCPES